MCYYTLALRNAVYAPVAQLDRVTDYESVGRGFESLPAYHISRLTLIELDGNFLYSKQNRNTHILCQNRTFAENDCFRMCISLKLSLLSRVANRCLRVSNRGSPCNQ